MPSLSRSVAGQVVVITGAASGMGRAEVELFAAEGAKVAALDVAPIEGVEHSWVCDVADPAAVTRVIGEVVSVLGPVDILVNNAGVALLAALDGDGDAYESAWERTLAVNLTAHQRLARACLPSVSRIVNIASTEGIGASRFNSPYVAAKHGVIGLTRAMAVELGASGVTVNAVCPGPIRTGRPPPSPTRRRTSSPAARCRCGATASPRRSPTPCCRWPCRRCRT